MAAKSSDKALVFGALLVAAISGGVFSLYAARNARPPEGALPPVRLVDARYVATISEAAPIETDTWAPPVAQSRGRDWIYDTFTPPEIFFNGRTRQFTVKPPSGLADDENVEAFGLELLTVRPEPFRLQLIGYVGEDRTARGAFENVLSGEVFLAATGRRIPNLALTIKSLDLSLQPVELAGSMTTRQRVATATIRDERTGREVTLTHRERRLTGTIFALVAAAGESATREVRPGDTFKVGEATYHIDKIELSPPALEVTKESAGLLQPDRRTLTPREGDAVGAPEGTGSS